MDPENILAGTASLFLALADKTRLRLLNLMRDREICVSSFTGTLGHSQPLISRHLAYLRNSGIVEARRDGKWMHYSLSKSLDENTGKLLFELFRWMEAQDGLRVDREKYRLAYGLPEGDTSKAARPKVIRKRNAEREDAPAEKQKFEVHEVNDAIQEPGGDFPYLKPEPEYQDRFEPRASHNELEDFLL
jgi:ArsR family transcriptional regulator